MKAPYLIVICGPTGVGKTTLAIQLAKFFNTEIISADSRQLYKELTIGTAKPDEMQLGAVKHHLINFLSIKDDFNAGDFERIGLQVLEKIFTERSLAILCGGSGLYIKALLEGLDELPKVDEKIKKELREELQNKRLSDLLVELKEKDPEYYSQVDQSNPHRIIRALAVIRSSGIPYSRFRSGKKKSRPFKTIKIGINLPREELYNQLNNRLDSMIEQGLLNEAASLLEFRDRSALRTVGYQEAFEYLDGTISREESVELMKKNSRNYAKRQMTWFRKDPGITWFKPGEYQLILGHINRQIVQ